MKINRTSALSFFGALLLSVLPATAQDKEKQDHDHDHHHNVAGPHGGRLLTEVEPHLEFLVREDRKVQIAAVNEEIKQIPIAAAAQDIRVVGGDRKNPVRMSFQKEGDVLVSDKAFPEGNDFPVVVQIKTSGSRRPVLEKFNLNLEQCPTCDYREYACICDHHDHDHDHKDEKKKK